MLIPFVECFVVMWHCSTSNHCFSSVSHNPNPNFPAREAMAPLLLLGGAAFEALAVEPDALARDVARLPKGLYA